MTPNRHFNKIDIRLSDETDSIFILAMTREGAINRWGDLEGKEENKRPAMGRIDASVFQQLIGWFDEATLQLAGRYAFEPAQGTRYSLLIELTGPTGETGFEFVYYEEGVGPPEELVEWLVQVQDATDPWFQERSPKKRQAKK